MAACPYQIEFLLPNANANLYHQIYLVQKSKITLILIALEVVFLPSAMILIALELQYSYIQLVVAYIYRLEERGHQMIFLGSIRR